ncbi:MAG: hypothetical protein LBR19_01355 [Bifidobacteriaceae bacterium]|jgi:hypothetical protein|nr:hypothetical protein [Bifidobacteriaceae bacterium]
MAIRVDAMMVILLLASVGCVALTIWFVLGRWSVGMDLPVAQTELMEARARREQKTELAARLAREERRRASAEVEAKLAANLAARQAAGHVPPPAASQPGGAGPARILGGPTKTN